MGQMKMRQFINTLLSMCLLFLLVAPPASGQVGGDIRVQAEKIAGSILVSGHIMEYEQGLSDGFGGRLTGSPAYNHAAEWAADQFRAAGVDNVKFESFSIAHGWQRGRASGKLARPLQRPLHIESLGWAPSTPPGGVHGEVIAISDISADAIKRDAQLIKGKVAMLDVAALFAAEGISGFGKLLASFALLKEAGAQAVVISDFERNNVINALSSGWGSDISPLPIGQVGMEDAALIRRRGGGGDRLCNRGPA
jgi:hypothetical protein